jgi:hypothetical protein
LRTPTLAFSQWERVIEVQAPKTGIDKERIESYRGTVSLPFEPR